MMDFYYAYVIGGHDSQIRPTMWQSFSDTESVLTSVVQYLSLEEVGRCRQVSKRTKSDIRGWRNCVLQRKQAVACSQCPALRHQKHSEYCRLCESAVCLEHLEQCHQCEQIYCSSCVGFCCL